MIPQSCFCIAACDMICKIDIFFYLIIKCMQSKDYDAVLIIQITSRFSLIFFFRCPFELIWLIKSSQSQSDFLIIWRSRIEIIYSFSFSSFVSSKIHFLVTISVSIRNFSKFSMSFFVSKSVLSVVVWGFISLIMIDRWFVKWRQCNNRCFEIWIELQYSLHLFVS